MNRSDDYAFVIGITAAKMRLLQVFKDYGMTIIAVSYCTSINYQWYIDVDVIQTMHFCFTVLFLADFTCGR